jgi:hypothetical protein
VIERVKPYALSGVSDAVCSSSAFEPSNRISCAVTRDAVGVSSQHSGTSTNSTTKRRLGSVPRVS